MLKFILKGSFSRPLGAIATILVIALAVVLLYSVFSFGEAVYDYYLGEPDTEAGSSDIIISTTGVGAGLVPMGNIKTREDIDYAIGSISLYCMFDTNSGEEAVYLRTFEKAEIETLHDIFPVTPLSADPKEILMDGVIISQAFADYNNLKVGDKIELTILGKNQPFYVTIIAQNSGYFYNNPNVIVGVSSYISYLMDWNLGRIYNRIYVAVNESFEVMDVMESISSDPNFAHAEVNQSFNEEETKERVSVFTTIFDFAGGAIILLSLLMIYKIYQLIFLKKINEIIKLRVIGLSKTKISLLYMTESLLLSILGAVLGSVVALPSFNMIIGSALPGAESSFSFIYLVVSMISVVFLSLCISLLPILSSSRRSIRENMSYSKSPHKKYSLLISIFLLITYAILMIIENTVESVKGIIGVINTVLVVAVFISVIPVLASFIGRLFRRITNKVFYLSSLYIGKNENLNIALQLFVVAIMFAIFISNSLNVTVGYNESYEVYARDKLVIANSGSMSQEEVLSLGDIEGVTETLPTLEIQGHLVFPDQEKSTYAIGIDGEDLSSFYNVTSSNDLNLMGEKLESIGRYVVVSDSFRYTKHLKVGDSVKLKYKNMEKSYEIIGFVSTSYNIGKVVFINRMLLSEDFSLDKQNLIYLSSTSQNTSATEIKDTFFNHNIHIVTMSSFVQPVVRTNMALSGFLQSFSLFILSIIFAGVIINTIMSNVQRKTDSTRLILLGVSQKESLLYSLLEGVLIGLPITLLAFIGGLAMLSSSISATIFFGFYQPFSFQLPQSILLAFLFFLVFIIVSPIFSLISRPKNIASSLKTGT